MSITLTAKKSEAIRPIPEALYKASIKSIEEKSGEFGDFLKVNFEISEGEYKGEVRNLIASKSLSISDNGKDSKLYKLVKTLLGEEIREGESINLDQIIGKKCQIFVKNGKVKDGVMYQLVDAVVPM